MKNRSRVTRSLSAILLGCLATAGISSCGYSVSAVDCTNLSKGKATSEANSRAAVILAPTDNFVSISDAIVQGGSELRNFLESESSSVKQLSVVVADGHPHIVAQSWLDFGNVAVSSQKDTKVKDAIATVSNVAECLNRTNESGVSITNQSDMLEALKVAADTVGGADEPRIFIYGNGIQTAGDLHMEKSFPASSRDVKSLVSQLEQAVPPAVASEYLGGARVTWVGLGQVTGDGNDPLNAQSQRVLVDLWQRIVSADGGSWSESDIASGTLPDPNGKSDGRIHVDPVNGLASACTFTLNLPTKEIGFLDQTAILKSDAAAQSLAKGVAQKIAEAGCSTPITLTGYVASGTTKSAFEANPNAGLKLSQQRADVVKELLKQAGVTIEIRAVGKGKGPTYDWDASGNQDEKLQDKNRIVVVKQ